MNILTNEQIKRRGIAAVDAQVAGALLVPGFQRLIADHRAASVQAAQRREGIELVKRFAPGPVARLSNSMRRVLHSMR